MTLPELISYLQLNQANANNNPNVIDQAINQYPILKQMGLTGVMTNAPGKYGGIESWPAGETGEPGYERPKELPLNQFGVQVFSSGGVGGPIKPIDVLADAVSHNLVKTDPQLKKYYGNFIDSLTEQQYRKLEQDYAYDVNKYQEKRPLFDWATQSRLPAYFRGYTFNQWPDEWNKQFYTPDQINILNKTRDYLGIK